MGLDLSQSNIGVLASPVIKAGVMAFTCNVMLTPILIWLATRYRIFDRPGGLKTHDRPIPYLGGVGVFLSIVVSVLVSGTSTGPSLDWIQAVLGGAGSMLILGLVDDLYTLPIVVKLIWESATAGILIYNGMGIELFHSWWLNSAMTMLWVVGMTNALNLIDIMDGLSGTIAATACVSLCLLSLEYGLADSALLASVGAGATMGFLVYNWPRARIFLGDAGSLQLGFVLASLAISARYTSRHVIGYIAPLMMLALPITETFFLMWQRARQGRPIMWGSRDHMALRLERAGWTRPNILWVTVCLSCVLCLFAYAVVYLPTSAGMACTVTVGVSLLWLVRWMHMHP